MPESRKSRLGHLDFRDWFLGIVSGFIQGGAGAVTSALTVSLLDPQDWGLATGPWKLLTLAGSVFLIQGVLGAMAFLRTHSIPAVVEEE